jgi:hypothetical protein
MFKKIEINLKDKTIRMLCFKGHVYFRYTRDENNIIKWSIPLLSRSSLDKDRPVFYLKINNNQLGFTIGCLQQWIDIAKAMNGQVVIICDNEKLLKKCLRSVKLEEEIVIIKSDQSIPSNIINAMAIPFWRKAARAHLTSFYHANKNNIHDFWNIDADDTTFFAPVEDIVKALNQVKDYANAQGINCFSLDMHSSYFNGILWNFGVTYVHEVKECMNGINLIHSVMKRETPYGSVDNYFAWLRNSGHLRCESFNISNLYFLHWGQWEYENASRLLSIYSDGYIKYPFIEFLNTNEAKIPVAKHIINFDTGITEAISKKVLEDKLLSGKREIYKKFWQL